MKKATHKKEASKPSARPGEASDFSNAAVVGTPANDAYNPATGEKESEKQQETLPAQTPKTLSASCLRAALNYAKGDWFVFPGYEKVTTRDDGKIIKTKQSHKSAEHSGGMRWGITKDRHQIRTDFSKWPDAWVCLPTQENSIFTLDIDTPEGHDVDGLASLEALETKYDTLPLTRMARSPSGSIHYYFNFDYSKGMKVANSSNQLGVTSEVKKTPWPGIDVRGWGGMVVAPPSVRNGVAYEWLNEADVADAPQWLLDLVIEKEVTPTEVAAAPPQADLARITKAMAVIPNNDVGWDRWNTIGLALYRATGASKEGLALFITWSMKSKKFGDTNSGISYCNERWSEFQKSPPDKIGAGSIFRWADEVNPKWETKKARAAARPLPPTLLTILQQPVAADDEVNKGLFLKFISEALWKGISDVRIIEECLSETYSGNAIFTYVQRNAVVSGGDSERYVKDQIATMLNEPPATAPGHMRWIRIHQGKRHEANDATQKALVITKCPVYVRALSLVEPIYRWETATTKEGDHDLLTTSLVKLNLPRLSYMIAKHAAIYQRWSDKERRWQETNPPKDVIEQLLELKHWPFPTIKGIINSPTMRSDGSLVTKQGYDQATQLWYKSSGDIELPDIPEHPTKEEAQRALKLITDLLSGFPFRDEISKAVAVAGLMTVVLRGAFEFAPMFLILAPESGSGKSYLVTVIATLASGRPPMPMALSEHKEEREKQLDAAAFEAKPILHLNNLTFDLESANLNTMISEGYREIRPFGKNTETITCDCRGITVFANGNNIRIIGDLVRRTPTSYLDAKMERPETRTFDFDPVDLIKADRGKYLAAVFTIARAYLKANCPNVDASPLVGFEPWLKMVRNPLVWLGMEDALKSMETSRARDPVRIALRQRIDALALEFGTGVFTAADVDHKINKLDQYGHPSNEHSELRDAFSRSDGKRINSKYIGNQLMKDIDRVSGGCAIKIAMTDAHKGNEYQLHYETDQPAKIADTTTTKEDDNEPM